MAHMTDEEAERLDEKWTKNPPRPGPKGTGYFSMCKKTAHTITIDNVTVWSDQSPRHVASSPRGKQDKHINKHTASLG